MMSSWLAIGLLAAWCAALSWRPVRVRLAKREERRREDIEDVIDEMREREEASLNSYLTPITRPLQGEPLDDAAESVGAGPR